MFGQARDEGVRYEVVHLSNSPSALTRPDLAFDMVRPGIAVYGQTPIPERGDMGLKPAMTLKCPVALVRPVQAGDGVSYGHTWIAERDTTAGAASHRLRRRRLPQSQWPHRRVDQRQAAPHRRARLHGPTRGRRGYRRRRLRGRRRDPVRAGHRGRTHRSGLGRTARHHQLRGRHEPSRPRRAEPIAEPDRSAKTVERSGASPAGWRARQE